MFCSSFFVMGCTKCSLSGVMVCQAGCVYLGHQALFRGANLPLKLCCPHRVIRAHGIGACREFHHSMSVHPLHHLYTPKRQNQVDFFLKNFDEIMAHPGIMLFPVGMYRLSISLTTLTCTGLGEL